MKARFTALNREFKRQSTEDNGMRKKDATFDASAEIMQIQARRTEARRRIYKKSRLDKYRSELVALRKAGGSLADIALWLRVKCRFKIHRSSIGRYIKMLPELQDTPEQDPAASGHLTTTKSRYAEL
jgi:hypothetical protein